MKVFEVSLFEAQNYEQMFNSVFSIANNLPDDDSRGFVTRSINEDIKWAKRELKKSDRIIWYLRIVKYRWLKQLERTRFPHLSTSEVTILAQQIDKELSKLTQKYNYIIESSDKSVNRAFRSTIEHFLSLPITKITNYVWSNQPANTILKDFEEFEEEWKENSGERAVGIQEGDKLILEFDNGTKGWWLLSRGACREEGGAMGHCGNVPSVRTGDKILSFRTKNTEGKWTPNLTFILDKDGYLGEMKGRGNEKPATRYHPYIIELLKQTKLVKGIKGGGYAPENNFSLRDLSENQREELIKVNPEYMDFSDMVKRFGPDNKSVIKKAMGIMDQYISYESYDEEKNWFVIESWKDADDLVSDYGNDTAKSISSFMSGDRFYDLYYDVSDSQISTFLNDLDIDERRSGKNYTTKQKIIEWLKNFDPEFNPDEQDWVDYIIENDVDDIKDPVSSAILDGERVGAESEMYDSYKIAVKNFSSSLDVGEFIFEKDEDDVEKMYDEPIKFVIKIPDIVKMITDAGGEEADLEDYIYDGFFYDTKIEVDEPYYGWSSYDESAAVERFYELLEESIGD
jgi:hypothetical protein